jgi:hypothetical protein
LRFSLLSQLMYDPNRRLTRQDFPAKTQLFENQEIGKKT